MTERRLVARARELFGDRIGDDAAVVGDQVITTDLLIEDVDFTRMVPLPFIARKALAVNLSDIAAMGAAPSHAVVALGTRNHAEADALMTALAPMAREYGIEIVGGDLSRAEKLTIAITAVGRIGERALLRSGARAGERVYLSRPVGGAAAGLSLMQKFSEIEPPSHLGYAQREFALSAIRRQIDPEPEVRLGLALARVPEVSACIDVSDGLSTDLNHLCEASGVGAEIERERIPIFPELLTFGPAFGIRPQIAVLHGGEEYALLFTSSLRESELSTRLGRPVYAIGRMGGTRVILKENGEPHALDAGGWDHFTSSRD